MCGKIKKFHTIIVRCYYEVLTAVNDCAGVDMRGIGGEVLVVADVGAVTGSGEICTCTVRGVSKAIEGTCFCGSCSAGGLVGGAVETACGVWSGDEGEGV